MAKLNQIIGAEKGVKARTAKTVTESYHLVQKGAPFSGITRTYQPRTEDGDLLPPERTNVQKRATDVLNDVAEAWARLFDVTATKDATNTQATADVKVDGRTVAQNVPVTTLLFLEKQLNDVHTLISKLPVLDPAENWTWSDAANQWVTEPSRTVKTKKVPRNHVKAEATERHPAQVEVYHEDVPVGDWTTIKMSGAMPAARIAELLKRVEKLQDAVKAAREEANSVDAADLRIGTQLFEFILEG